MSFGPASALEKVDTPKEKQTNLKIVQTFGDYYLADVSEVTPGGPTPDDDGDEMGKN